ncbi:MAG: hypothetical protein V7637_5804 [Mycobacteriales bacterium]|jgi:hypothetical protein
MQIRGSGFPAAAMLIRTWVTVLDRCVATVAFAVMTATVLLLLLATLCPDE